MSVKAIRGFKDILPEETGWWQRVESAALCVLRNFGFEEFRVPIVERTELFARSIGQDTDIVEKEMYSFSDRHGDSITLRPEATAGVVRAVIEHGLGADGRPLKFYTLGPMFRYERPQKGRQRQFYQLNVEIYNVADPFADAELITLWVYLLEEIGLEDVRILINSLGCQNCRPGYKQDLKDFLSKSLDDLCSDCRRRFKTNPLRILDCKVQGCMDAVKGAPRMMDSLCPGCRDHFSQVQKALDLAGTSFTIEPNLVRGLDYYTRTVFEAHSDSLGAQSAVGGGGRYDLLVKSLGGPDMPAVGFAMGLERLIMLLSQGRPAAAPKPDLFVAVLDDTGRELAFSLAMELKKAGVQVEMEYSSASLKSQMRRAGKLGAAWVLLLGPDEISRGHGGLKNMDTGEQSEVALDGAVDQLKALLRKGETV